MYAGISPGYLPALRGPHEAYGYLEAWRNGTRLTQPDGSTRLPISSGGQNQVTVDGATPGSRRTLTATLAKTDDLWDLLAPIGTELRAYTWLKQTGDVVPQGVFVVDVQRMGYAAGGDLQITAPDRWERVTNARFLTPRASIGGVTIRQQIINLLLQALPAGTTVNDLATSTATVPAQTWDRDRGKAIQDLATAASIDVFFDRNGIPTLRDQPVLDPAASAWTVDLLTDASRERNRQRTYNVVVVNGTKTDGTALFGAQYVWDNDPTSDTYAGPDPVNHPEFAGPFGVRPTFYSSPLLADAGQAQAAGLTILERVRGLAKQLTLTAVANPALDDGDTITVRLPRDQAGQPRPSEVHIVDGFTVPLGSARTWTQTITTRSTRPDDVQDT